MFEGDGEGRLAGRERERREKEGKREKGGEDERVLLGGISVVSLIDGKRERGGEEEGGSARIGGSEAGRKKEREVFGGLKATKWGSGYEHGRLRTSWLCVERKEVKKHRQREFRKGVVRGEGSTRRGRRERRETGRERERETDREALFVLSRT